MCDIQTVESPRPDTKLGRKKGLAATQVFTLSYSWTPGGKMVELRWPGGGLFEEILSWDTSIIQRRSLYLWVASFVSILHGRATSSRAMKWWLAASLSSTSCVSTGFYQRQSQTKNIAFHFAQCNSIQFNLWNGIHFPEQIAPLAERNLFEKVLLRKNKYWLMFETSQLAGQTLPMSSHDLLGRLVWNCVGWPDGPKS